MGEDKIKITSNVYKNMSCAHSEYVYIVTVMIHLASRDLSKFESFRDFLGAILGSVP